MHCVVIGIHYAVLSNLLTFRTSVLKFIYFRSLNSNLYYKIFCEKIRILCQHACYFSLTAAMAPFSLLMIIGESVNKQIHLLLLEMNGMITAI